MVVNKKKLKEILRDNFPNIDFIRKFFSRKAISKYLDVKIDEDLIIKAEREDSFKDHVIAVGENKWPKFSKYVDKEFNRIISLDRNLKELDDNAKENIKRDMRFCIYAYGITPTEYSVYNFINKKDYEIRNSFISERYHMAYTYMMNDLFEFQLFNDKTKTYEKFKDYYKRDVITIETEKDFEDYIKYISNHPIFVKKQVYESCGNSIEKINIAQHDKKILFEKMISDGKTILEEIIVQGDETAVLNKSSVNTVRVITFRLADGRVIPAFTFMKIGREGSFVDNGGAGGILVGIDENTGIFNTVGIDENNNVYEKHPDTGVQFLGFELPKWNELIEISKEVSKDTKGVNFIGWDFAYSKNDGWVIVEGNGMSQFIGPQSTRQKGIKKEVEDYLKKMNKFY